VPAVLDACRAEATLGEISDVHASAVRHRTASPRASDMNTQPSEDADARGHRPRRTRRRPQGRGRGCSAGGVRRAHPRSSTQHDANFQAHVLQKSMTNPGGRGPVGDVVPAVQTLCRRLCKRVTESYNGVRSSPRLTWMRTLRCRRRFRCSPSRRSSWSSPVK
jgi:hypothetical protein